MSGEDRETGAASLTRRAREARNARIYADRARGLSWAAIEACHGVGERQGRRIVDAYVARHRPTIELDPNAVVRELLAHFDQAVEDMALLAAETENDAVKLGAITRRLEVVERRVLVLRSLRLLPDDWARWQSDVESSALFARLVEVLRRRSDVPDDLVDELLSELEHAPPSPSLSLATKGAA